MVVLSTDGAGFEGSGVSDYRGIYQKEAQDNHSMGAKEVHLHGMSSVTAEGSGSFSAVGMVVLMGYLIAIR